MTSLNASTASTDGRAFALDQRGAAADGHGLRDLADAQTDIDRRRLVDLDLDVLPDVGLESGHGGRQGISADWQSHQAIDARGGGDGVGF